MGVYQTPLEPIVIVRITRHRPDAILLNSDLSESEERLYIEQIIVPHVNV